MKSTSLIFYFLVLCTFPSLIKAQQSNIELKFLKVEPKYQRSKKFAFQIKNNSNELYRYYVGLQAYYDSSWHEVVIDIDPRAPKMSAIEKKIKPKSTRSIVYNQLIYFVPSKDPNVTERNVLRIKNYRLTLNYRAEGKDKTFHIFSNEFLVK